MTVLELLKVIAEGGALVLLAAVLVGLFVLIIKLGPPAIAAWNALTKEIAGLRSEVHGMRGELRDTRQRASQVAEDVAEIRGAATVTGQHTALSPTASERKRGA